jgi:hypothetical protein
MGCTSSLDLMIRPFLFYFILFVTKASVTVRLVKAYTCPPMHEDTQGSLETLLVLWGGKL